jgi:ABC-type transport system substrate-binding protein
MSLRTRQGLGLVASIMLMAAACTGGTATPTPAAATPPPATATPAPVATPTTAAPTGTPVATPAPTPTAVPTASASAPVSSSSPTTGGSLVMGEWQPVSQLNPFFTTAFTSFEALGPVLHGLLTIDNSGNWSPDLATEVPSIANGDLVINPSAPADCTIAISDPKGAATGTCFTLTLKLKPGLMWSDGTPLTMQDFLDTYNWASTIGQAGVGCSGCSTFVPLMNPTKCVTAACIKDPSTAGPEDLAAEYAADNQYIKSITVAADGLSAVVVWQKNFAGWLGWASGAFLQGTWLKGVTAANATTSMPVGAGIETVPYSGPFKIMTPALMASTTPATTTGRRARLRCWTPSSSSTTPTSTARRPTS